MGWQGGELRPHLLLHPSSLTSQHRRVDLPADMACLCSRTFSRGGKPVSWAQESLHEQAVRPAPTYPAEWDAVLLEDDGRDECHLVPQEGVAALGAPGEEPCGRRGASVWSEQGARSLRLRGNKMHCHADCAPYWQGPQPSGAAEAEDRLGLCDKVCPRHVLLVTDRARLLRLPLRAPPGKTRYLANERAQPGGRTWELMFKNQPNCERCLPHTVTSLQHREAPSGMASAHTQAPRPPGGW